ncbi:MAG: tetratricopeptide repeat protein [Caulobacteraceae bacterium]|nr:tetratricopeptide repeat protein [Caulobacteraceae bacterium]
MRFRISASMAALAAAFAVAAPLHAQTTGDYTQGQSIDEHTVYGSYVAGRAALHKGDSEEAAQRLEEVAGQVPDNARLRQRAFTAALYAGDVEAASRLAPAADPDQPSLESLGRLVQAVEALSQNRGGDAVQRLTDMQFPHRTAAALLRPWAQAQAGDWNAALGEPENDGEKFAKLFGAFARAQLLEIRKKPDDAEAIYRALAEDPVASVLFLPMYGDFLERRGRRAEAIALYDKGLAESPDDFELTAQRDRAQRRLPPPRLPTLAQGGAKALQFAAEAMSANRQVELSMIYMRLALHLDPTLDRGWIVVGDALARQKDDAEAREAWARVTSASIYYDEARTKLIYSLQAERLADEALRLAAEDAHARPANVRAQLTYADMLRAGHHDEEALAVLTRLIEARDVDWRPRYMRAISLDRLGRWPEAEADLTRALELSPNQAETLNYLGYAWIDRGEKIQEGMALVERAAAGQPRSGAIQDSLAWAHFKLGQYDEAVTLLESAVLLTPADPEVNDHLGDAYWMVGRRNEANFQWRRVLSLEPTDEQKARAERKLREGLPPPAIRTASTPAT